MADWRLGMVTMRDWYTCIQAATSHSFACAHDHGSIVSCTRKLSLVFEVKGAREEMGDALLHYSKIVSPTSEVGQKRTSRHVRAMSALPPKADIHWRAKYVR